MSLEWLSMGDILRSAAILVMSATVITAGVFVAFYG
jgi:hypothetical protein